MHWLQLNCLLKLSLLLGRQCNESSELRQKTVTELNSTLVELGREQFNLRMQKNTGQLSKFDQVKKVRRNIARVKTVVNEMARQA